MNRYKIGQIVNAVALRGEVKVYNYSDANRFEQVDKVIAVGKNKVEIEYEIEKIRYQQEMVILKLAGVNDRNAAEALKGYDLFITEDDLRELPDDTFYIKDLVGLPVVEKATGNKVGTIKDVIQNTVQDVYVITLNGGKETMIPAVKEFIKEVSMERGEVVITPIPGMIDDNGLSDANDAEEE